jgi:glutamyl-tRNA reductase
MVVGEDQILGQVRAAVKLAGDQGTVGRVLNGLGRLALRTGKRARAETGIGKAGLSLLTVAIELAAARLNTGTDAGPEPGEVLAGRDVLIVGAGSMSALAAATAARSGAASIVVANRTREHAEQLATQTQTAVTHTPVTHIPATQTNVTRAPVTQTAGLEDLPAAMAAADIVISCTGAAGPVITASQTAMALKNRAQASQQRPGPLVILDLAMPRDVEPAVTDLPGVVLIGMDLLGEHGTAARDDDIAAVRAILEAELASYHAATEAARVAPTVVALRAKAAKVVDAELARLAGRLSGDDLSGHALDEIAQTVRRVVDKLLHAPTVRVKELAGSPGGEEYAAALRVLFDLDPRAVEAVTRAAPEQEVP